MSTADRDSSTLILFDVDGTLTMPRLTVGKEMRDMIDTVRSRVHIGIVGGSDHRKIIEQMAGEDMTKVFDYVFSENGLVAYKGTELIGKASITEYLGEETISRFLNWVLVYLGTHVRIPKKRGTFVEYRNGMINVSPVGRSCSQEERLEFAEYDKVHSIRAKMVSTMQQEFADLPLTFSIGGQISIDVFPTGWDKTYCLRHVEPQNYSKIHFFGDKTSKGGNDYEIFSDERTIGHTVTSPEDTVKQLKELLNIN